MTDCSLTRVGDRNGKPLWRCGRCAWEYAGAKSPRRNCDAAGDLPIRPADDQARIRAVCQGCVRWDDIRGGCCIFSRCQRQTKTRALMRSSTAMCPEGKWG